MLEDWGDGSRNKRYLGFSVLANSGPRGKKLFDFPPVLRIYDILMQIQMQIQILRFVPPTNRSVCGFRGPRTWGSYESGSGSKCGSRSGTLVHLHHSLKIKSHKEVTKQSQQGFSYIFCLMMDGSGVVFVLMTKGATLLTLIRMTKDEKVLAVFKGLLL